MATLNQPEASAKPAWIVAIATTVRRVLVSFGIGGVPVESGGPCRLAQMSPYRPTAA